MRNIKQSADSFKLADGQNEIRVPLTVEGWCGLCKTFTLKRGSYNVGVDFNVKNNSAETIEVQPYRTVKTYYRRKLWQLSYANLYWRRLLIFGNQLQKYSFQDMEKSVYLLKVKPVGLHYYNLFRFCVGTTTKPRYDLIYAYL